MTTIKPILFKLLKTFVSIVIIVSVALFIRLFLLEIYLIPSSSMAKTILPGDVVLVTKFPYGPRFSCYSKEDEDYIRLGSVSNIKRFDIIVFNYPMADSIYANHPHNDFYKQKGKSRQLSDTVVFQPVQFRQPYIKRCIGLPGDTLEMKGGHAYINSKRIYSPVDDKNDTTQWIMTRRIAGRQYPKTPEHRKFWQDAKAYRIIFPNNYVYMWNHEIFGPVVIPQKGMTIKLDLVNIWLYKRAIETYEHNNLEIKPEGIFINNKPATSYTFKMNFYFMLGDNHGNSIDSIFWGFVPEDHIIGKAQFIVFSSDKGNYRWERMFTEL